MLWLLLLFLLLLLSVVVVDFAVIVLASGLVLAAEVAFAGCIYVHNIATCILDKVFPPVCVFPYSVYSKIFTGSGFCSLP